MAPATLPTMGVTGATALMDLHGARGSCVNLMATCNSELGSRLFNKMLTIKNVTCILKK